MGPLPNFLCQTDHSADSQYSSIRKNLLNQRPAIGRGIRSDILAPGTESSRVDVARIWCWLYRSAGWRALGVGYRLYFRRPSWPLSAMWLRSGSTHGFFPLTAKRSKSNAEGNLYISVKFPVFRLLCLGESSRMLFGCCEILRLSSCQG